MKCMMHGRAVCTLHMAGVNGMHSTLVLPMASGFGGWLAVGFIQMLVTKDACLTHNETHHTAAVASLMLGRQLAGQL